MLIVLKFGSLNLLEPSEPVQACNGSAFTLTGPQCGPRCADGRRTENCLFVPDRRQENKDA